MTISSSLDFVKESTVRQWIPLIQSLKYWLLTYSLFIQTIEHTVGFGVCYIPVIQRVVPHGGSSGKIPSRWIPSQKTSNAEHRRFLLLLVSPSCRRKNRPAGNLRHRGSCDVTVWVACEMKAETTIRQWRCAKFDCRYVAIFRIFSPPEIKAALWPIFCVWLDLCNTVLDTQMLKVRFIL